MTTYENAIDIMYGVFKTAWDSGASPIIGYVPNAYYDEPATGDHDSLGVAFARLTVRNVAEGQITLGSPDGPGTHEYGTIGLLIAQIFVPKSDTSGVTSGRRLAKLVRDAYRVAGGEVWFKDVTVREQPPGDRWRQFNVNVEYDFTETT
jgi:hypothetical protein